MLCIAKIVCIPSFSGALRTEKVELSAQVKKQQARILYLDEIVDKLSKEVIS